MRIDLLWGRGRLWLGRGFEYDDWVGVAGLLYAGV